MTRAWMMGLMTAGLFGSVMNAEAGAGRPNLGQLAAARQAAQLMGRAGKAAALQGARQNGQKPGARFDKNGDGMLDPQERQQAMQAMQNAGGKGGLKGGPGADQVKEAVLKRFDKDGDGKLNENERAEARKAREERQKN